MRSKASFLGLVSCVILLATTACAPALEWNAVIACWQGETLVSRQEKRVVLDRNGGVDLTQIGTCGHVDVYLIAPLEEPCR